MRVINKTKNTVYVADLDLHIPFEEGKPFNIPPDWLKQSKSLRSLLIHGDFDIVEYDESERIEKAVVFLKNKSNTSLSVPYQPEETEEDNAQPMIEIPSIADSENLEVVLYGLFYDASGYAKVNRNLAFQLHKAGVKVKIKSHRSPIQVTQEEVEILKKLESTKVSKNAITIDSIIPSFGAFATGKYKILYTTIESYTLPEHFVDACRFYQEIWLTSRWSADILRKYIKDIPICAVRTGVDRSLYTPSGQAFDFKPNVKDFVFVSVFGWSYRKGYDVLIKSYFKEFSDRDNISLLIVSRYQGGVWKASQNKIKEDIDKIITQFPNKDLPHLVRYSKVIPEKDMPKIYRAAHCFVLSSRAEGLCLPPLEAGACGLPVIMTDATGQTDYLTNENSYPLEIDFIEKLAADKMHVHYWDNQEFPSLTSPEVYERLGMLMRHVYENYKEAKEKNKKMMNLIYKDYVWEKTASVAIDRLRIIKKQMGL